MSCIKLHQDVFGKFENPKTRNVENVIRYTLENCVNGVSVQVINYGATITSLKAPNKDGILDDIVLGFDDMDGYRSIKNRYFGATIGRVANRIGKGQFYIDGTQFQLPINNGPNSLHGGVVGFDKQMWNSKAFPGNKNQLPKVIFSLLSPDGDQGYPGDLLAQVTFQLRPDNQLKIDYQALTNKPTPVALTNHSYFNLGGHDSPPGKLDGHFVYLNADNYTPLDDTLVTKGEIASVKGTAFDFTEQMRNLKERLETFTSGYDNNFCLNKTCEAGNELGLAARLHHLKSGRVLEVFTDQPGLQFYTGNFLPDPEKPDQEPIMGKGGAKYWKHSGICLETQNYPNAVNHRNFPDAMLQPGEIYKHSVIYKMFAVKN